MAINNNIDLIKQLEKIVWCIQDAEQFNDATRWVNMELSVMYDKPLLVFCYNDIQPPAGYFDTCPGVYIKNVDDFEDYVYEVAKWEAKHWQKGDEILCDCCKSFPANDLDPFLWHRANVIIEYNVLPDWIFRATEDKPATVPIAVMQNYQAQINFYLKKVKDKYFKDMMLV